VELAILRVGVFELLYSPELPARVVINEAIDLSKTFGAEKGHRYVNGVLDKVAKRIRAGEMSQQA
jgi:N utilization substance protein B